MAKKKRAVKKESKADVIADYILKVIWFIIKIPYYLFKGIYRLAEFISKKTEDRKIKKTRELMVPVYEELQVIKTNKGNYQSWEKKVSTSDSEIGIILGARGSGKTALGLKLLENARAKYKRKCYAMGFDKNEMPDWIINVEKIEELKNDSVILIDEGGILFSSRKSMSNANKLLSDLILISRHKNLSIIFISQNSANLEVNVLRQADFLILKSSSLLQKNFERKIIQDIYNKTQEDFNKFKHIKGVAYIYSDEFDGFISNPLPSFWKMSISKAFR